MSTPTESQLRQAIVDTAKTQVGKPYQWGGDSPKTGFDCSGLVSWAYSQHGLSVPHNSEEAFAGGKSVGYPGIADPVFFRGSCSGNESPPCHEAMYIGGGQVIVAPHTGANVQITDLAKIAAADTYMGARTYIGAQTTGTNISPTSLAGAGCALPTVYVLAMFALLPFDPGLAITMRVI